VKVAEGLGAGRLAGRLVLALALSAVLVAPTAGAGASVSSSRLEAYAGLGTWLPIYVFAKKAWRNPERQVAAMARNGAQTLYLETGNYKRRVDVVRPRAVGRFVDAAHAAGLRVVAWYLPSFGRPSQDERRALAAIRFRSASGERFDAFALDIEATIVRRMGLRNQRLLRLSARLRKAVGPAYPLGAITPSPVGMSPSYWPNIPYRALTRSYDVFLPMAYSTMRGVHGSRATLAYLSATVAAIRTGTRNPSIPIHLIGGLSEKMGAAETAGFMHAVADCAPLGFSLYAFPGTRPATWTALTAPLPTRTARDGRCS
jgi:hypothetical protein